MATPATEAAAAAAATPVAPAEGSVIAIHSLDAWSTQIEQANSAKKLVLIDFTASWCGPCRIMAPIFTDMAKKNPNVVFLKVDVDEMKAIAEQFSVEAMPTFLFMKEGDVKDRVVGAIKDELAQKLQLHQTL
ncbi:thioredoxin H-type-like isoform X2 [Panicum virgatum]|uniref:thioredoxin H-type-like isoform X2 n=1 Tax=Panicum virgatum TaxID=38727 RepID=UPI0019D607B0|nr:thioredoxin H-type-like isoform X2 [Panicum virgatum]